MNSNQEKIKKTCSYNIQDNKKCDCIFHSKDIEGKKAAFNDEFWQEFARQKSHEDVYDFTGFVFPVEISFEGITFEKKVYFNNAQFHGRVKFDRVIFSEDVYFGGACFFEEAFFGKARFSGTVHFSRTQFSGDVSFVGSQFHINTFFWNTQFTGKAKFTAGKFVESVDFRQAHFDKNAEFAYAQFSGRTDFRDTLFQEKADFNQANFAGETVFGQTKFYKEVSFWGSQFSEKTDFRQAHFLGEVVFAEAQFLKRTTFWGAKFFNKADFVRVQFYAETSFVSAQFLGITIFNQAKFNELANFDNFYLKDVERIFMEECYFFDISGLLEFIEHNKKKFKFSRRPHKNEFLPDHFTLILGEKAAAKYPLIDRKIRDDTFLASFRKRHPFWHHLWWLSTDCGRSFRVLGAWCFVISVFFAAVYRIFLPDAFHTTGLEFTWISSLYFSFITFTTLGFGDITPIKSLAQIVVTIEVIMGYGMLGLLISIMANKLARRS